MPPPVRNDHALLVDRPRGNASVRVLSYNVRSLRDDVDALVAVIRECRPDVVCLQEAPRFLRWRALLAELARRSGLFFTCGGATTGGPALLTALRVDVEQTAEHRLSKTRGQYQRGVAAARIRFRGTDLLVASTHLGLDAAERRRHAREVTALLDADAHRVLGARAATGVVLAGDLNEGPGEPAWTAFLDAGLRDSYAEAPRSAPETFTAAHPRWRIDAVLVRGALDVRGAGVPEVTQRELLRRATDHLPVLAELRVAQAADTATPRTERSTTSA